jgi:hypothetical protein
MDQSTHSVRYAKPNLIALTETDRRVPGGRKPVGHAHDLVFPFLESFLA